MLIAIKIDKLIYMVTIRCPVKAKLNGTKSILFKQKTKKIQVNVIVLAYVYFFMKKLKVCLRSSLFKTCHDYKKERKKVSFVILSQFINKS